jgi:poly(hydroxyalkanoate) depolymerase family esterase
MPDKWTMPDLGSLPGLGGAGDAGNSRPYRLHVPENLPAGPRPLLVLLHGGTQDGSSFAGATGFDALADAHGFIALYPEQVTAANPMRYWNWFKHSDQQRDSGEPAILAALVEEIADLHPIDSSRVYVAGFSAGAAMASVLGATYPDVFAGIGVHSGLAHGAAGDMISAFAAMRQAPATPAAGAIPVIVIHGDADPTVHVSNASGVLKQFAPVDAARRTVRESMGGRQVERTVVEVGGRTVAEQLVVSGSGHTWSGGRPGGSYADPSGPDAAAEMVRFFGLAISP